MSILHKTADITGDDSVNEEDLQAMAAAWLLTSDDPGFNAAADLNYDGKINNTDSDILSANWLTDGLDCEEHYYYHYDGLGSVVALSDSYGNIVERYEYDVYGETLIHGSSPEPRYASVYGNPYMFTGRRFDIETGLYYYRARYYYPYIGRFLQVDPIGYADSMNLYIYVGNNPIMFVDPYGLWTLNFGGGWGIGFSIEIGHNSSQWSFKPHIGLGAGAHISFDTADTGRTKADSGWGAHFTFEGHGRIGGWGLSGQAEGGGVFGDVTDVIGGGLHGSFGPASGHLTGEFYDKPGGGTGARGGLTPGATMGGGVLGFVGAGLQFRWGGNEPTSPIAGRGVYPVSDGLYK